MKTVSIHDDLTPEQVDELISKPKQRDAFERAKQMGYLVEAGTTRSTREFMVRNAYYRWCKSQHLPCAWVLLNKARKTALIEVDFITTTRATEEMCAEAKRVISAYALAHGLKWRIGMFHTCGVGTSYWYVARCPREDAETLTAQLVAISRGHHASEEGND